MKTFEIKKAPLANEFTGINSETLGIAVGELNLTGLRLYLYLAGRKDKSVWTVNPAAFAEWCGAPYVTESEVRKVRKWISDGAVELEGKGYAKLVEGENYLFSESKCFF